MTVVFDFISHFIVVYFFHVVWALLLRLCQFTLHYWYSNCPCVCFKEPSRDIKFTKNSIWIQLIQTKILILMQIRLLNIVMNDRFCFSLLTFLSLSSIGNRAFPDTTVPCHFHYQRTLFVFVTHLNTVYLFVKYMCVWIVHLYTSSNYKVIMLNCENPLCCVTGIRFLLETSELVFSTVHSIFIVLGC